MNPLLLALFPLVNAGTQLLRNYVIPRAPHWSLPLVNVGLGIGLDALARALGGALGTDPQALAQLATEGTAIGGAATISHNVVKNTRRKK